MLDAAGITKALVSLLDTMKKNAGNSTGYDGRLHLILQIMMFRVDGKGASKEVKGWTQLRDSDTEILARCPV